MRTISWVGIGIGLFVAGVSIWRWTILYDSPFRLVVGCFIALSLMAWAYIIDWMTLRDKKDNNLHEMMDSLKQEQTGIIERVRVLYNLK